MEEEERAIMKAKVEEPILSEQVEMFIAKPVEEEVVFKQAEVEVIATRGEEDVISRQVEEDLIIEQDEKEADEGVFVKQIDEFNMSVESFDYDHDTGQLSYPLPMVNKEMKMTNAKKVEEEVIINQAEIEVEAIITAKQDPKTLVYSKIQEKEEEKGNESKVSFSMEDLEYDDATGQLFIHLESGMVEVTDPQSRDQLLAKMSSIPDDDRLLACIFPLPEARATTTLTQVPDVGVVLSDTPPVLLKPINFRLQEQRLTCGHLGQSRAQSLGRWTSWTRDLLISDLEAAFTKPRRSIFWSDFSPEEKLARFDMVDWGATYPLDPPPRSLMFEPAEDHWSTWA